MCTYDSDIDLQSCVYRYLISKAEHSERAGLCVLY